jgi:hypothetical protein
MSSLPPGRMLGPYEVLSPTGAGGQRGLAEAGGNRKRLGVSDWADGVDQSTTSGPRSVDGEDPADPEEGQ